MAPPANVGADAEPHASTPPYTTRAALTESFARMMSADYVTNPDNITHFPPHFSASSFYNDSFDGSPHPAGDLKINIPHQANEAHRPVDYPRKTSTNQSSISSTNTERQQTKPLLCSSRLVPSQRFSQSRTNSHSEHIAHGRGPTGFFDRAASGAHADRTDQTKELLQRQPGHARPAAILSLKRNRIAGGSFLRTDGTQLPRRVYIMLVDLGGINGTTITACIIANRDNITWNNKEGPRPPTTTALSQDVPFSNVVPMDTPATFSLAAWGLGILSLPMDQAMARTKVINHDLQNKIALQKATLKPLPTVCYRDFIAANQEERADDILPGTNDAAYVGDPQGHSHLQGRQRLDSVVSIEQIHPKVSPSPVFANAFVPGCIKLAERQKALIGGNDLKTGQTKVKSVLGGLLVNVGIKPLSIASISKKIVGHNDNAALRQGVPIVSTKDWVKEALNARPPRPSDYFPLIHWLPSYNAQGALGDLIAGITVALVLVPQSIFAGVMIYALFATSKDFTVGPVAVMSLQVGNTITRAFEKHPNQWSGAEIASAVAFLCGVICHNPRRQ
ncbi:hypothetical protein V8E36_006065 [Tilletia maclaganii]